MTRTGLTVALAIRSFFHYPLEHAGLQQLQQCEALSSRWRDTAARRLSSGLVEDWSARLLGLFFGSDQIAFSTTSDGLPGVTRSFTTFSEAAEEAGQSRVYGGIHWQYDNQVGLTSGRALAEHVFFNVLTPRAVPGTCNPSSGALCLAGGRFKVEASWQTEDAQGPATGTSLGNDSGAFWFFDPDNAELTVKVLNACDGFGRYWVFASGLTDVEVRITVTDTQSGRVRSYFNPQGKAFAPVQDVSAFATCP